MSTHTDIANRHLLPTSGLADAPEATTLSVRVIVNDEWARSVAGQLLVSSLINILCRQATLISRIEIIAPNTSTLILLPGGTAPTPFPACLEQLAMWAVNDVVTISATPTDAAVDYTIAVGGGNTEHPSSKGRELIALGDGWRGWIGERLQAPTGASPHSSNPLGPFLAASLVAGEIFKRSRGILRGRYLTAAGFSLWSGRSSEQWDELDDGPELSGRSLPPTHVAGTGAVGNGLAYVIANAGFAEAYLVLIDDDTYDGTNLNRCMLAGWEDVGQEKVKAVVSALTAAKVGTFPFPGTIKDYMADARAGLRSDVAAKVDQLEFDIVVSCVDKGISRQDVQGLWPKLVLGGSTLGLQAKTNVYALWAGAACLACYNPAERDGDKVRALEATLRNMPADQRRQFLSQRELDAEAIEEYLSGAKCGGLGEIALKDFATRPPREFSAGFVSLGAALLLSAALFRHAIFAGIAPRRMDMTTLNYLNGGLVDAGLGADESCQLRCADRPKRLGIQR